MKIVIVYPPCEELNLKGYPLGLAYLSAFLNKYHDVTIRDYNGSPFRQSISCFLKDVKKIKPDIVAISFNSFNRAGAYHIIKQIKRINRKTFVVLGGVHASALFDQLFDYFSEYIDFIICGEGEKSLLSLADALSNNTDYRNISGLVYRNGQKKIVANPVSDIVHNLDDLPLPDFSYAADEIKRKKTAFLITSRGCPVNCMFCSTSSFWGQKVRMNSPQRIMDEVEMVKRLGAKYLFFHDDTFNLGISRTIEIAGMLKTMNVEYAVQCRVKPVNDEMIAALVDSGCKHISWGVESLSDKILEKINKNISKEEARCAFETCAPYSDKLTTSAYCCVGIPGETENTIKETVDYMNKYIKSTQGPGASMLYILPGTRLYQDLVRNGRFNPSLWIKTGAVYYYTKEHSMRTLNRWRKMVNRSGIRIKTHAKFFWDYAYQNEDHPQPVIRKKVTKIIKKIKRFINMRRNKY